MRFSEIVKQATALLRDKHQVSERLLKREFALDEQALDDLRHELIEVDRVAIHRPDGVLVWRETGGALTAASGTHSPTPFDDERRHVTVLFCDMVGYTALAEKIDPEALQELVTIYSATCTTAIERFAGSVFQRWGDGIVAFFGHPVAHEDDAERAVHAGLKMLTDLAELEPPASVRIQARVGIATGLVVMRVQEGAVGETMNLAARLQAIADPGQVIVSGRVMRLIGNAFTLRDLGEQTLKGFAEPVRAYEVLASVPFAHRLDAASQRELPPLVGRDHELALLHARWRLARDGHGQLVLLGGEPGIGKSRILTALLAELSAKGAGILRFQCSPYHTHSALHPGIDNLERALKFAAHEAPANKLDKLKRFLVLENGRPPEDLRFFAHLLSIPCAENDGPLPSTPQKLKSEAIRALVDLVHTLALRRPTLMLFEDAHWADPTTLDALDALVAQLPSMPLMIALTYRPEFQARWTGQSHVTHLNLNKLSPSQSVKVIHQIAGRDKLPQATIAHILAKTDGIPLFLEELTKAVLEATPPTPITRYQVEPMPPLTIPATLRDSLMARLDRFPSAKKIAQIGAVIGREFSYALILAAAPEPPDELDLALEQLVNSGLLFRRGLGPDTVFMFKHALVQDAAYDSLLKSRRRVLHARVAQILELDFPYLVATEPELLAHHLFEAERAMEAVLQWRKAGVLALSRMALPEALKHLSQGLGVVTALPASAARDREELELRAPLGTTWMALKGWSAPEVWEHLFPALALAKSLGRRDALLTIYDGLWNAVLTQGRLADALRWVQEILDAAIVAADKDLALIGHRAACTTHFWRGEFAQSQWHGEQVLALYNADQHRHLADVINMDPASAALTYLAINAWIVGFPDRAVTLLERADRHAGIRNHPFDLGHTLMVASQVWDWRRDGAQMRARAETAERLGRAHGLPFISDLTAPIMQAVGLVRSEAFTEGTMLLEKLIEPYQQHGGRLSTAYMKAVAAQAHARLRDFALAGKLIDESLAALLEPDGQERAHLAEIYRIKGAILEAINDDSKAESYYREALALAQAQGAKGWELRAATSLARLYHRQQRAVEGVAVLAPRYAWFTEGHDTPDLTEARDLLQTLT